MTCRCLSDPEWQKFLDSEAVRVTSVVQLIPEIAGMCNESRAEFLRRLIAHLTESISSGEAERYLASVPVVGGVQ